MRSPESDSLSTGSQSIRPLSPLDPAEDLRRDQTRATNPMGCGRGL